MKTISDAPLMVAVSKLSYETVARGHGARHAPSLSCQRREIADITIFDPATVKDNSDFELGKNSLPSTGIRT